MQGEKPCITDLELMWKGAAKSMFLSCPRQMEPKATWSKQKRRTGFLIPDVPERTSPTEKTNLPVLPDCFCSPERTSSSGRMLILHSILKWSIVKEDAVLVPIQSYFCADTFISFYLKDVTGPPSRGPICDCCHLAKQGSSRKIMFWHEFNATVVIAVLADGIFVSEMKLS